MNGCIDGRCPRVSPSLGPSRDERIIAVPPIQRESGGTRDQGVVPRSTAQDGPVGRGGRCGGGRRRVDVVVPNAARKRIRATASDQGIISRSPVHLVAVGASDQGVVARTSEQGRA